MKSSHSYFPRALITVLCSVIGWVGSAFAQTTTTSLTVNGPSTLNGTLNVSGVSTFTNAVSVTGLVNISNNLLSMGIQGAQGSSYGLAFQYADSSVPASSSTLDSMTFIVDRYPASWLWEHNTSTSSNASAPSMRLDSSHKLLLFPTGATMSSSPVITLTPSSSSPSLALGTATLTANNSDLSVNGAFTAGGNVNFIGADGSLALNSSGVALSAVGGGKNITFTTPVGSGDIVFNTSGAERARIKSSGYVGIGTANPTRLLSINGASNAYLGFKVADVLQSTIGSDSNGDFFVFDDQTSTYRMVVNTGGNVGIGTTAPATKLDVQGGWISTMDTGTGARAFLEGGSNGIAYFGNTGSGDVFIGNGNNWGYLTVKNGGNVGIGTTVPGTKLHVFGNKLADTVEIDTIYPPVTASSTNYVRNLGFYSPNLPIASGVSDSGYRIGLDIENFVTDPNFLGTLASQYGLWARVGSYSGGAGTIQNSYGIYIENLDGPATIGNKFGLYQSNSSAKNFFAGNVGIGSTSPAGKLEVNLLNSAGWGGNLKAARFLSPDPLYYLDLNTYIVGASNVGYQFSPSGNVGMVITTPGNVGIGTTNPGNYKLAVLGSIHATSVVVETGWSDYVFDKDYRLAPLSEVEQHIKAEKHLPGIPSAAEVAEHGVSLGDMQSRLLAKVEELTLHLIEQEKRIQKLEQENASLRFNRAEGQNAE